MSGGYFTFQSYRLEEIIEELEQIISNNIEFSEETIREFKNGIELFKKTKIYVNRIDYLLEGDDSEESFHERLQEELNIIMNTHTEHCCVLHGCKYNDTDCPVVNRQEIQSHPCETCDLELGEWNLTVWGNYPEIPEGKFGVTVDVIVFDRAYSKFPDKNLSVEHLIYGDIYDKDGNIFDMFRGTIYEIHGDTQAFMTLYSTGEWGPIWDEPIAWKYTRKVPFLTQYVINCTKKSIDKSNKVC